MEEKMCPYPGLRPFNDDESIFFRGRERNIDTIIELFEVKKFMMLTGASGDGKSSLVYAGVVPQARAGLFKAKYNNWAIADFRPERAPLLNLTNALNKHFKFESTETLINELGLGFSSLIKTYKNSPLYIDTESKEWIEADEVQKKQLKRKASNLLIIADQFEEFFTNNENFNNGVASVESQTVINLLLETAKIALAEDIPVYVICTMRSDYIGQCAAFRGLPEYIGFSQFFVPRLKRLEIQQVIEEPANLNGNKISDRLIQRLLFDISDGLDQLPILQHALNQIWKMADRGNEEMDLIHYAMVSGLPADELPPEDQVKFTKWFSGLPKFKKLLFAKPSLENILNAHANELLESAYQNCIEKNPSLIEKINPEEVQTIIKTTFQCLTKIDAARAVRNRMTLQEITDIINNPKIDVKIVGKVLDIFREQGNTFIKPFITEEVSSLKTHKHTVLDITHESLIRNWDILNTWAYEEFENWNNFQDFNKQLQRWVNSGKASGYLLPIGPLTFFENWYNKCNPNKYWLARYDEDNNSFEEKLIAAEENLSHANEFLKRSASKLFITRSVMKYGANKIMAIFGLVLLFAACTFYYFDYRKKQNDHVIKEVSEKGLALIHSNQVAEGIKAKFIVNYERLNPHSMEKVLNSLKVDTLAFDIAFETFEVLQDFYPTQYESINPVEHRLYLYLDSVTTILENRQDYFHISRINRFLKFCSFLKKNHPKSFNQTKLNKHLLYLDKFVLNSIQNPGNLKTEQFNTSIELMLTISDYSAIKVHNILAKLSPFDQGNLSRFNSIYPRAEKLQVDWDNYLTHKGGYQILSYLYAVTGDYQELNQCLDTLIINNPEYKKSGNENIFDIVNYILKYQNFPSINSTRFIDKYLNYSSLTKEKFHEQMCFSFHNQKFDFYLTNDSRNGQYFNSLINFFVPINKLNLFWDSYLNALSSVKKENNEQRNLSFALYYKQRGIFNSLIAGDSLRADECFKSAFNFFEKLPEKFLEENYIFYNEVGDQNHGAEKIRNSVAFLYPQRINPYGWQPLYFWYNSLMVSEPNPFPFLNYILKNNLLELYETEKDVKCLEIFLYQYYLQYKYGEVANRTNPIINDQYFDAIIGYVEKNQKFRNTINADFVKLILIDRYFETNNVSSAFNLIKSLNLKEILAPDFQKQPDQKRPVNIKLLQNLALNLASNDSIRLSWKVLGALLNPWDRRNCMIDICYQIQSTKSVGNSFQFLDSLFTDLDKKTKVGMKLFMVNGLIGGNPLYEISMNLYKDIDDKLKPRALSNFLRGISKAGLYYKASTFIPKYASRNNELDLYNEILHAEVLMVQTNNKSKNLNAKYWNAFERRFYGLYIPENFEFELEHFQRFSE